MRLQSGIHVQSQAELKLDLVCQVQTIEDFIVTGDSIAVLEAETYDGIQIRGEDAIRIVP